MAAVLMMQLSCARSASSSCRAARAAAAFSSRSACLIEPSAEISGSWRPSLAAAATSTLPSAALRHNAISSHRTFASSAVHDDEASLKSLFFQLCGDEEEPPTTHELNALRILLEKFHVVHGPDAVPTKDGIEAIYETEMQSLTGTAAPAVAKTADEEWEEYNLTPEERAEVEAVARAPKKIQRAILEEDLKASMRSSDKDLGGEDEDDEDRRRQERMFDMRTVSVQRTCKKNKGGGLFRFQAFVVIGNGDGVIGYGMGKAAEVVGAIDKAYQAAERNLFYVERYRRHTIFEVAEGKCTKTKVKVWPRPSGTGIRTNDTLANICGLAGIEDVRAKVHGSRHKMNMVKAFFQALEKQRNPADIAREKGLVAREVAVF